MYGGKGQFCSSCMQADHTNKDCGLHLEPSSAMPVEELSEPKLEEVNGVAEVRQQEGDGAQVGA